MRSGIPRRRRIGASRLFCRLAEPVPSLRAAELADALLHQSLGLRTEPPAGEGHRPRTGRDPGTADVGREGHVLGHEIYGEVVAVGPDAEGVQVGDRRVVYPWIGCGECAVCQRGDEHLCTPGRALGIVVNGGFASHVVIPHAKYLFDKGDVPDSLAATYACSGLTADGAIKKLGDLAEGDEVVIIGAGFGGLEIARSLKKSPFQVVLIDKNNFHCFQPLMYQVATGGLEPASIAYPVRRIFRNYKNIVNNLLLVVMRLLKNISERLKIS